MSSTEKSSNGDGGRKIGTASKDECELFDEKGRIFNRCVLHWKSYRKRPILVGAARVGQKVVVKTLEGEMAAEPGDYIIRGVKGELYPCKPDIFEETYQDSKIVGLDGEEENLQTRS